MSLKELPALMKAVERFAKDRSHRGPSPARFERYRMDPVGYMRDVLHADPTPAQQRIAGLLMVPPYRVLAPSAHNVGKSWLAACLASWRYDCWGGATLTTAPTDRQVTGILWKELRRLRYAAGLGGFVGPKMPRMEAPDGRWAHGYTARDAAAFQGQHERSIFIVFDEAEGVAGPFWEAAETMLGPADPWLCIYNPVRQDTQAFAEEQAGGWHVASLSATEHPNIVAELAGQDAPIPSAIRLARLREQLKRWGMPITPADVQPGDAELAPGEWYRPGPVAEARCLGRRPTRAVNAVWSQYAWSLAETLILPPGGPLRIGCDVARFGDDDSAFHVRRGGVSLHHESANGWDTDMVAMRCRVLADEWAKRLGVNPAEVVIVVDDCGVGGGVTDQLRKARCRVVGLNPQQASPDVDYPNLRSALWFGLAEAASARLVTFAHLDPTTRARLRSQFLAPTYTLDVRGRRVVESKDDTKHRLGRSPDDADACMLAYANVDTLPDRVGGVVPVAR